MTMKPKTAFLIIAMVIVISAFAENMVYAESISQSIRLTITVVGALSLNIEEDSLIADSEKMGVETVSLMKDHDIAVTKPAQNDSDVWLFTKTE